MPYDSPLNGEERLQTDGLAPANALTSMPYVPQSGPQGVGQKVQTVNQSLAVWQLIRQRVAENHSFAQGVQWTDDEIQQHLNQGRNPVSYNIVGPMMRALMGKFQGTKKEWIVYPREDNPISQMRAQNLAFAMNSVAQQSDWDSSGSLLVAQDALCGLGWASVYKNTLSDGTPYFCLDRVDWHEIVFDTRTRKPDLSDCYWLARQQYRTIPEALSLYAEHEPGFVDEWGRDDEALGNIIRGARGLQSTDFPMTDVFNQGNTTFFDSYEVPITEYFERKRFRVWVVLDGSPDAIDPETEFGSAQEAAQELDKRMAVWQEEQMEKMMSSQMTGMPFSPAPAPPLSIEPRNVSRIVQTCYVNQQLLTEITIESDRFPYTPFFQFFDSGAEELSFWGFVDVVKEPQKFMNRTLSMMDLILGGAQKNVTEIDMGALKEGQTPEQLTEEMGKPNPMFFVNDGMLGQAIKVHPTTQFPPGYTEMLQIIRSLLDQTFPSQAYGQALPGAQGGVADPSGRALALQNAVADNTTAIIFSSYAYSRRLLGESLAFSLQHDMDGPMTFQLLGKDNAMKWITLNQGGIPDTIVDEKFLINVSDEDYSPSAQQQQYSQLAQFSQDQAVMTALLQVAPQAWLALQKAKVQVMQIPEELKMEVLSSFPPAIAPPVLGPQQGSPSAPRSQMPGQLLQPTAEESAGLLAN